MLPVPIGRFHQQVVGVLEGARIAQDLCVVPAQVSGKNDAQRFGSGAQINLNNSRTQNVACVADSDARVLGEVHHLAVIERAQLPRGLFRVSRRVEGQSRLVLAVPLLVRKVRILLLQVGGIQQRDFGELACRRRGPYRPVVSVAYEAREHSDVIDVGVRQEHVVQRRGLHRKGLPILQAQILRSLKHAAVHHEARASGVDEKLGPGYGF